MNNNAPYTPSELTKGWSVDLSMNVRSRVDSYRDFLKYLVYCNLTPRTHKDTWSNKISEYPSLCIRHDVDHNIDLALAMAVVEYDMGIKASYYLLPPGDYDKNQNYYGHIEGGQIIKSQKMLDIAKEIFSMGHEIGLHNDFLQLSRKLSRPLYDVFSSEIEFFDNNDMPIKGSASHGSRFARAHGYVNYEIFEERYDGKISPKSITIGEDVIMLPCISMKKLGLEYEAYFLPRQNRISDVGGKLQVAAGKVLSITNFLNKQFTDCNVEFSGNTIVLIHPEHWVEFDVFSAD